MVCQPLFFMAVGVGNDPTYFGLTVRPAAPSPVSYNILADRARFELAGNAGSKPGDITNSSTGQ